MESMLVAINRWIKTIFGVKTYVVECSFVFLVLCLTALFFGKNWEEWIAVFAVFFTFCHASVAQRLEEKEDSRKKEGLKVGVSCYRMITKYFYTKEALWFFYFFMIEAYSALAGVVVFLCYPFWRKTWREKQ